MKGYSHYRKVMTYHILANPRVPSPVLALGFRFH